MTPERQHIEAAISALEAQRALLGDAVVDASLTALRAQLSALTSPSTVDSGQTLKQVTILFLDVVGSTALSQHLDPEAISEVMDDALRRGAAVVEQHGGKVLKYAGDNILAAFGADEAREDDAERAVRCGLALLALSRVLGDEVQTAHGHAGFGVRVGIHTGRVLLGGGVDGDGNIRGSSVNIAARMEQTAPAGCLRISHDTYVLVRGLFDVEAQEPLAVKGVDMPVRSYLVSRAKSRRSSTGMRGVEGVSTRMVGRSAELGALQDAFRRLFAEPSGEQRLAVVTVVGDAGIGKSRLLDEFAAWRDSRPERFHVFRGRATPQMQDRPFALLGDIFARRFQIADGDNVDVARRKMEEGIVPLFLGDDGPDLARAHAHILGHLMGIEWKSSAHLANILDDARQIRNRAFYTATQWFRRVSGRDGAPIVLQLDDLHAADRDSLDFLSHLIDVDRDVPLLILASARPSLFERSAWMHSDGAPQVIELAPLSDAASDQLASELLGRLPHVPAALRELIIRRAEGNPYFMEELVNMLVDQGAIETQGSWKVNAERLLATDVPATLTGVLQSRLDGLPAAERLTLQQASVLGPVFWAQALEALDSRSGATLSSLVSRGLVLPNGEPTPDGLRGYAFRHQLLHQVTYDTVLKRLKRELHAKAAHWLSLQSGLRAGEFLGVTAEHYERAGDPVNAAEFHVRAAEHAKRLLAHDTVLAHAGRALALLDQTDSDPELRWRMLRVREATFSVQSRRDEQAVALGAMAQLAERLDDDEKRAHTAMRCGGRAYEMGDWSTQESAARDCIAWAERAGDDELRLLGLRLLAAAQITRGEVNDGANLLRTGLAEARRLGLRSTETLLLNTLSVAADAQNDALQLLDLQQQCLQISQEVGDRQTEALALGNLGVAWCSLGDLARARSYAEQSLRLSRTCGAPYFEGNALCTLSEIAQWEGDHAGAASLARSAHALHVTAGARSWQAFALLKVGEAELAQSRFDEATKAFEQARSEAMQPGEPMQHDVAAALARVALARRDSDEALHAMRSVLDHLERGGSLEGAEDVRMIEWTLHRVLAAMNDPRAPEWLARVHESLQRQAAQLPDSLKQGFFNNIPYHREIVAAWAGAHAD